MKKLFQCATMVVLATVVASFVSCKNEPDEVEVISVTVDSSTSLLSVKEIDILTATVLPENAADKTVVWSSDNEAVATVNASGMITGVSVGSAVITATTANGKTASCTVTVEEFTGLMLPVLSGNPCWYGDYYGVGTENFILGFLEEGVVDFTIGEIVGEGINARLELNSATVTEKLEPAFGVYKIDPTYSLAPFTATYGDTALSLNGTTVVEYGKAVTETEIEFGASCKLYFIARGVVKFSPVSTGYLVDATLSSDYGMNMLTGEILTPGKDYRVRYEGPLEFTDVSDYVAPKAGVLKNGRKTGLKLPIAR
ncbi:MAG: Ig-like domain-containing protein [Prevotellaceae bacterium]|jgi:hypothetical protein|nr:Ig-like domain-containing protein [Prevotellaceae bacterium]